MLNNTTTIAGSPTIAAGAPTPSPQQTIHSIQPSQVFDTIGHTMLLDALDLVVDLKRSNGSYIYDSKTHRTFLDFFTFVASMPIGMNHPKMMTKDFLEKLTYASVNKPTNSDVYTVEMAEFVDAFARLAMPSYLPHVFFVEGGALGVENALKAAFDWKMRMNLAKGIYKSMSDESRMKIIHFRQAFHGRSGYTLSLTNTDPVKIDYFPKFQWPRIDNPAMKFPLSDENLKAVMKAEEHSLNQIKAALHQNKEDIAALIIEPIQGEGGDNHFRKEFFVELRRLADESNFMLIFDEVQTGVGLTGKMWAHQHFVQPDMISFGKKTQVCGFMAGKRIEEVPNNVFNVASRLNSTWGGNLTDMVRSQRYLEIIHEDNLVENARVLGDYLQKRLNELQSEFPTLASNSRGRGLFCALDLPTSEKRNDVRKKAFERGLIILGSGERSLRFRPPLTINQKEIDEGINILRESLHEQK
jgi:L-lysine 6-transaminase